MVFLDQKGIKQSCPVIVTASCGHRVLLGNAQSGQGFSGVEQLNASTTDQVEKVPTARRGAGQGLQKVHTSALPREQTAGTTFEHHQHLPRSNRLPLLNLPLQLHLRIELAKDLIKPGPPADHTMITTDNPGHRMLLARHQGRGNIAAANILCQRLTHIDGDGSIQLLTQH